jgi:hypothetical protein
MNIYEAKKQISQKRQENRPWHIALGVLFGIGAIATDFYVSAIRRAQCQEVLWSLCSIGYLFLGIRRVLKRTQLLLPFGLTLLFQVWLVLLTRSLFPFSNSLLLILLWIPGIFVLGFVFAGFSRLLDPSGPRPE